MIRPRVVAIAALAAVAILATSPAIVRADGDPASDYLYTGSVFVPAGTPPAAKHRLAQVVAAAQAAGEPIKVAVIGSPYDLGSITPLWQKPSLYARFLGVELSYRFHGLLLVEMPNGFGIYHHGRAVATELRALEGLNPGQGAADLTRSAGSAVLKIAAADGHPVLGIASQVQSLPAGQGGGLGVGWLGLAALIAGGLVIAAFWSVSLRLRPVQLSRRVGGLYRRRLQAAAQRGVRTNAIVGGLWILAAAFAALAVIVHLRAPAAGVEVASGAGLGGPVTWKAHARPAPSFSLRDQDGRPVSLRSSHGHVTIMAFVDPVCRNLCPLEAAVLGQVERKLGPVRRPAIVAVSVDPWGNARHNLVNDITKWKVGPAWRWAIGSRAQLSRVWSDYQVGVTVRRLHVGGVTVHEISHDELIYVLDGHGDIRALYTYPFSAAAVVRTVSGLESS